MQIQQLKQIISRYLQGKATVKETMLVEEWLQEQGKDEIAPDKGVVAERREQALWQVKQYIGLQKKAGKTARIKRIQRVWIPAAACLILLAGAFVAYLKRYELMNKMNPVPMQTIAAGRFSIKEVLLPDGSVVTLNSNSVLHFPQTFRGKTRMVQLTGEAYFKIKQDPAQSFIVDASGLQVRVLGTSFTVSNTAAAGWAGVGVTSGKVGVQYAVDNFPETQLVPGEQLLYDKQHNKLVIERNATIRVDWAAKRLIFKATPLQEVFDEVEQTYGVKIQVKIPLRMMAFTGSFDANDSLQDVLKVLSLSYRLTIESGKNGTVIVR